MSFLESSLAWTPEALEAVGWIGSAMFSVCGLPQAVKCWRQGDADSLSWGFLGLWLGGELFTLAYVLGKSGLPPLLLNYGLNIVFLSIILWFKVFPRGAKPA